MKVIAPSTTVTGKFPVISDNIGRNSLVTSPVGAVYTDDGQTLQAGLSVTVTGPTDYVYGYSATAPSTPGYYAVRLDGTDATGRVLVAWGDVFQVGTISVPQTGNCYPPVITTAANVVAVRNFTNGLTVITDDDGNTYINVNVLGVGGLLTADQIAALTNSNGSGLLNCQSRLLPATIVLTGNLNDICGYGNNLVGTFVLSPIDGRYRITINTTVYAIVWMGTCWSLASSDGTCATAPRRICRPAERMQESDRIAPAVDRLSRTFRQCLPTPRSPPMPKPVPPPPSTPLVCLPRVVYRR